MTIFTFFMAFIYNSFRKGISRSSIYMLKIRSFKKGGIHPHGRKFLSEKVQIVELPRPAAVIIPMSQHLGAPAIVCVSKGDTVTAGQRIGTGESFISADIHSSVNGTVKDIKSIILANGIETNAVFIETDNSSDNQIKFSSIDTEHINKLTQQELLKIIKDSGIVGMGGAAFPAHVKFNIPKGKKAKYLVINGVECEPYLTADHRLMLEYTDEILEGVAVISKIIDAEQVIIGIEANKMNAALKIEKLIEEKGLPFIVQPLKVRYPQGDEKQLLKATIGKEVPSGGLPIEIGAVVSNVGTAFAIYEAVTKNKPLIERVVTVTGDAVNNPGNFRTVVGTPINVLIEAAGGFKEEPVKMVAGGPMMGFAFFDLEAPVTKGTSGILALTKDNLDYASETACISCGKCVMVCPMGLQPTRLYKLIDNSKFSDAMALNLMDCKECGCCSFSCPAKIPLVHGFKYGKKMARKK
jgi:H+/Na+-translocating ferredoxin:NAD+ oxidoreductase subunit C